MPANVQVSKTSSHPPSCGGGGCTPNSICDSTIGHDLTVTGSLSTAPWVFGDLEHSPPIRDDICEAPIKVGNNVNVSGNAGRVDFSDNSPLPAYGVVHDLVVTNNTGGTFVESNAIGHDANCSNNTPPATTDGDGNTIGHNNNSCPAL